MCLFALLICICGYLLAHPGSKPFKHDHNATGLNGLKKPSMLVTYTYILIVNRRAHNFRWMHSYIWAVLTMCIYTISYAFIRYITPFLFWLIIHTFQLDDVLILVFPYFTSLWITNKRIFYYLFDQWCFFLWICINTHFTDIWLVRK